VKERLTGAIILVALIVLLVPELLTGPVRSTSTAQPGAVGSSGEPPLRSYTIDLADDARTRTATASGAAPQSGAGSSGPGSDPVSTAATEAKPPSISEGATPSGETVAQPGEEARPSTPESAAPEPSVPRPQPKAAPTAEAKVTPSVERPVPVPQPVKPKVGVPTPRTAPPEKRVSASPAPAERHAATPPASAGGGWLVQLGVFASRANADRLAQELKGKGFKVSVSEVTGKGKTLYRVHSAALADRAAAQDLAAKLHAAGASSAVMPRT
jgi:DedD protein